MVDSIDILHGKSVESTIDHSHRTGDKLGRIGHQVVDGSTEFIGLSHSAERSLTDDILSAFGIGTIGIGEQCSVLFGDEESFYLKERAEYEFHAKLFLYIKIGRFLACGFGL